MQIPFRTVRVIAALGAMFVAIGGLFVDQLSGNDLPRVGVVQALGTLVGLFVFAVAVSWRLPASGPGRIDTRAFRWTFAAAIASATFALHVAYPMSAIPWLLLGYGVALCVVLPLRFGLVSLGVFSALGAVFSSINDAKIQITGMPLTMLDIRVAVLDPAGFREALGVSPWSIYSVFVVAGLAVVALLAVGLADVRRVWRRIMPLTRTTWIRAAAAVALILAGYAHLDSTSHYLESHDEAWHPRGLSMLSDEVGIAAFLFHSARLESRERGAIFSNDVRAEPPEPLEVQNAVRTYISFDPPVEPGATRPRPNILVVLAESTFDPGQAFRLTGRWDERLFRPNSTTNILAELRVNAIGGGTWISEFETIVGLDSRFFGYYGYYAHTAASPFITGSLATYLRTRGYRTLAFFPHARDLFGADKAYERYGFEEVLDARDLWNVTDHWVRDDRLIASTVRARLEADSGAPFFAYVKLVENHWPHACDADPSAVFETVFEGSSDYASNCALNVFLRRLVATADAVDTLRAHMVELERRTGRPFVLLNFGDHQPHIFTSTWTDQFRTAKNPYITYFHLESSLPVTFPCCATPLPIAALPTILSAYAADGAHDVFLGENLWLYAKCGSDAFRAAGLVATEPDAVAASADGECEQSFWRAVAGFRRPDVVRLR